MAQKNAEDSSGAKLKMTLKLLDQSQGTVPFNARWSFEEVKRRTGKSPYRQLLEFIRLMRGPGGMDIAGYFGMGLWRPNLSRDVLDGYISQRVSHKINGQLSPPELRTHRNLLDDKLMFAAAMHGAGLATPTCLAHFSTSYRYPNIKHLGSVTDVEGFLRSEPLPFFGKPVFESRNVGAFGVLSRDLDTSTIGMGSGKSVDISALAAEITENFPSGFIFQEFVAQHPDLTEIASYAISTLRVVTVMHRNVPRLLYVILRTPGKATNVDDQGSVGSAYCAVDIETGRITRAQTANHIRGCEVFEHPVSGVPLTNKEIPFFDQVKSMTCSGHAMFAEHGLVGWDIAIGRSGPIIVEANYQPIHVMYQIANDRPFLNKDFKPILDRIIADNKANIAALKTK
jgi:hypothetical protein